MSAAAEGGMRVVGILRAFEIVGHVEDSLSEFAWEVEEGRWWV